MGRKRKSDINNQPLSNSSNDSSYSGNGAHTHMNHVQRSAANDRERIRMRVLSKAFVRLKTSLPWVPSDTKLSKLDTLKLATSYISYLTKILQEDSEDDSSNCNNQRDHNSFNSCSTIANSSSMSFPSFVMSHTKFFNFSGEYGKNNHKTNMNNSTNTFQKSKKLNEYIFNFASPKTHSGSGFVN
jgi:hypothetical protein